MMLIASLVLLVFGTVSGDLEYTDPILGYKGPKTPSCVDGTLYSTSNSKCSYPSAAIHFWVRQNWLIAKALFKTVPVYSQPPAGSFPKVFDNEEQCNYVEDYPLLQWVYSPDLGWVPVVQVDEHKQYFRLESCTSSKCSSGGSCRTFQIRARIIVWNGQEAVSTIALLPDACKCMLDAAESNPVQPLPPIQSEPDDDGRIVFPDDDSKSVEDDHRGHRRFWGLGYRRRFHNRYHGHGRRYGSRSHEKDSQPRCNPYKECWCPCRSSKCERNRERIKNCANDLKPCNPYIDCRCPCPFRDLQCVRYRKNNSPCRDGGHGSHRFGFGFGSRERFGHRRWWS